MAGTLKLLGLRPAGGNYQALRLACRKFGLEPPVYRGGPRQGKPAARPPKISWPDHDQLRMLVAATSYAEAGRQLGVSGTAIRKRLQRPAEPSRLPVSNGSPAPYKGAALPAELSRRDWPVPVAVALVAAAAAAGCMLALAIRDGSAVALAAAAGCCALVLATALA